MSQKETTRTPKNTGGANLADEQQRQTLIV